MRFRQTVLLTAGLSVSLAAAEFEVAAIKPSPPGTRMNIAVSPGGRFLAQDVPLALMIAAAYRLRDFQIIGAKGWIAQDRWIIEAKAAEGVADPPPAEPRFLNVPDSVAPLLRTLLENRFDLKTHRESREMPVYALTLGKEGSRMTPADLPANQSGGSPGPAPRPPIRPDGSVPESFAPPPGATIAGPGRIVASAIDMNQILILLGRLVDRPIIDHTGLTGHFNLRLQFDPESTPRAVSAAPPPESSAANAPPFLNALQEQLGLKLEPRKEPVEVLVIDSARKPSEN